MPTRRPKTLQRPRAWPGTFYWSSCAARPVGIRWRLTFRQIYEPFTEIISQGQAAGEVRTDFDARFLAEMVLGALNVAFTRWVEDAEFPLLQGLLQAADFICEAIEPRAQ